MKKMKVMTILGTRPEIIRLSEVIKRLDGYFDHYLLHTGQNYDYELSEIFFKEFGLRKADTVLETAATTGAQTVGNVIRQVDLVLDSVQPDAVLILGDTNSCMASYSAKRRHIPVFHMEAGNRCFDNRVPEELNRRLIDHMSDINLVYSERSRQNLIQEGLPLDRIIKIGSPMYEVLSKNSYRISQSHALEMFDFKKSGYIVFSAHREENVDTPERLKQLVSTVEQVGNEYSVPVLFSVHPRTKKRLNDFDVKLSSNIVPNKPIGFFDFVNLQKNSLCVISDSGTISEEASILNFSAVNIRESHERQEAMDMASVPMSGLETERVLQTVQASIDTHKNNHETRDLPDGYDQPDVSNKVVKIILSYTDYVERVNMFKSKR